MRGFIIFLTVLVLLQRAIADGIVADQPLVYQGDQGIGVGRHIVFLAGDHEYRSEEALPALARILAKHHGFHCTVLFNVDAETGFIRPGNSNMPHTDRVASADLLVFGLRFQNFSDEQMQPIADYIDRGGPIVGIRTSTHAFQIPRDSKFAKYDWKYPGAEMKRGFGRQVLGETWVRHYGKNHFMSTRLDVVPAQREHPVLRGVVRPWVQSGGYWVDPKPDSTVLALAQPLAGMTIDSSPAEDKEPCPGAWVRTYQSTSGKSGRVFTTTYGASVDLVNDDFRRLLTNGCLWAIGLDAKIEPNLNIAFVGPYHPSPFQFGGARRGVKPADLAGWQTPIMDPSKPIKPFRQPTK